MQFLRRGSMLFWAQVPGTGSFLPFEMEPGVETFIIHLHKIHFA